MTPLSDAELVGRLRKFATAPTIAPSSLYANLCGEAAAAIERLLRERDEAREDLRLERGESEALESALAAERAARERMEGALSTIANFAVGHGDVCEIIASRARAALPEREGGRGDG